MAARSVIHSCNRFNSIDTIRSIVRAYSVLGNVAVGMNRPAITMHSSGNPWWPGIWWPKNTPWRKD